MSLSIPVIVQSGLNGTSRAVAPLIVTPSEVGSAASKFGSQYILRMGLHFDRYVVTNRQVRWNAIQSIYATANPASSATRKNRATSVTGNIGECIAALVARRNFGALVSDIEPINAGTTRAPDFRIALRPMLPTPFQEVTGLNSDVGFSLWPVESKGSATAKGANRQFRTALLQLEAYWYMRDAWEPEVVGFGLIVCFVYKGSKSDPTRKIRVHVLTPTDSNQLRKEIQRFQATTKLNGFLDALRDGKSVTRRSLRDV